MLVRACTLPFYYSTCVLGKVWLASQGEHCSDSVLLGYKPLVLDNPKQPPPEVQLIEKVGLHGGRGFGTPDSLSHVALEEVSRIQRGSGQ